MRGTHKGKHLFIWSKEAYRNCLIKNNFFGFVAVFSITGCDKLQRGNYRKTIKLILEIGGQKDKIVASSL